jgi:hypothetical protein
MKTNEDNRSLLAERTDNEDKFDAKGYPKSSPGEDITETGLFVPGLDLGFDQADDDAFDIDG